MHPADPGVMIASHVEDLGAAALFHPKILIFEKDDEDEIPIRHSDLSANLNNDAMECYVREPPRHGSPLLLRRGCPHGVRTMSSMNDVAGYYTHGSLENFLLQALAESGKDPERLKVEDLGRVDEFHVGGREATGDLMQQVHPQAGLDVLDVGCGIGGPGPGRGP